MIANQRNPEDGYHYLSREQLCGNSEELAALRRKIELFSSSKLPVLITGETGTGKGVAARAIHHALPIERPFVVVDCGGLSESLIESELFGHVKGAFTGAIAARSGLFVSADGGTVFLDEIGELPLHSQVKLLRVLQEKEVRPVGSCLTIPLNVRVIAASNRDLKQEVEEKRFRMDLFYRLSVASLTIPPLRLHKSDIPVLVEHFIARQENSHRTIADNALEVLKTYDWPGNIRELENCIDFACLMGEQEEIGLSDLPEAVFSSGLRKPTGSRSGHHEPDFSMLHVERRTIEGALTFTGGDVLLAARKLGIGKTTLYRKLKEYGAAPDSNGDYIF